MPVCYNTKDVWREVEVLLSAPVFNQVLTIDVLGQAATSQRKGMSQMNKAKKMAANGKTSGFIIQV